MTSKIENFAVSYFLTRALFLGIGFSLIIGIAKQDSILAFLIGTIIGIFFIFLIDKVQQYKKDKSLNELLKEMKGLGIFLKIIFILFGLVLLCEGLTFIQLFASSFFLVKSPIYFISLPLVFLLILIAQNGVTSTFRVSACLFPLSITLTLLSLFALFGYADTSNITPLFITKPYQLIRSIFYYVSLSVTPSMLMLVTKNNKGIYSYLLGSLTLIAKVFLIIAIVGPILASIYRFPEYIILKEIKLLDFIEKIENIVALSWIFDLFVYISMSSLFIKELLPKKRNKIIHTCIIIAIFFISFLFIGKYYTNELLIYYFMPIFTFIVFCITIPILLIYLFKKKHENYF